MGCYIRGKKPRACYECRPVIAQETKMFVPKEIKREGSAGLSVLWSDNRQDFLPSRLLRSNCPSADSRAKRGDTSHEQPLIGKQSALRVIEASLAEELELQSIWAIGNYAIGLAWGDGHKTGIFTFNFLRELGDSTIEQR